MATCESRKQDSNFSGLAFAEEECLMQLPDGSGGAGSGAGAIWFGREPNSFSDFGGENTMVARSPIDPSRQNKKGTVVDVDASGGWNEDLTTTNMTRLNQGFFFADAREPKSTAPINGTQIPVTAVDSTTDQYDIAGAAALFATGDLVFASGFGNSANNGMKTVASATGSEVVVTESLEGEASPPAAAKLEVIGKALAADDISVVITGGLAVLTAVATTDFTTMGFFVGQWLFIGGDVNTSRFANNVGYARIKSIAQRGLTFDDCTWNPVVEAGAGKTIQIYTGIVVKNEKDPALIKRRSYNLERTLGMGENGMQAEYLEGAVANEFTLNLAEADKIAVDLSFVACKNSFRSGNSGDTMKAGTRVSALGEDAYNSTSNVYRIKMAVHDAGSSNPAALFGYVSEATITINNGVTPNKAIGVMGAFDTSAANFEVGGSATVYFTTVEAVRSVRNNADVGYNIILAARNGGMIYDIPLLSLGGGRINVEKDQPITLPLETAGAENAAGYTLLYQQFPYLPTIAMPV